MMKFELVGEFALCEEKNPILKTLICFESENETSGASSAYGGGTGDHTDSIDDDSGDNGSTGDHTDSVGDDSGDDSGFKGSYEQAVEAARRHGHSKEQADMIGQAIAGNRGSPGDFERAIARADAKKTNAGDFGYNDSVFNAGLTATPTLTGLGYDFALSQDYFNHQVSDILGAHLSAEAIKSSEMSQHPDSTVDTSYNPDGTISITVSRPGMFNDTVFSISADGTVVEGGSLSATLSETFGMSVKTSISVVAAGAIAVSIVSGNFEAALAPAADLLGVQGLISQETYNTMSAVGLVGGFLKGSITRMQSLSMINDAYKAGLVTNLGRIAYAGAIGYAQIRAMQELEEKFGDLGFSSSQITSSYVSSAITEVGGRVYLAGRELTSSNWREEVESFVENAYLDERVEDVSGNLYDFMAGSYFYNEVYAGGELFDTNHPVGSNLKASVTGHNQTSEISKMLTLQEDYIKIKFLQGV